MAAALLQVHCHSLISTPNSAISHVAMPSIALPGLHITHWRCGIHLMLSPAHAGGPLPDPLTAPASEGLSKTTGCSGCFQIKMNSHQVLPCSQDQGPKAPLRWAPPLLTPPPSLLFPSPGPLLCSQVLEYSTAFMFLVSAAPSACVLFPLCVQLPVLRPHHRSQET